MRIDLVASPNRPWPLRMGLALAKRYVGTIPAPPLLFTYRFDLMDRGLIRYMMRGTSPKGPWRHSETELFAAFVSNLNACHF